MGPSAGASELPRQRPAPVDAHEIARVAYERHGAAQRVDELAGAVALVADLQPRVVVEIGCDRGGTLYCWRQLCPTVFGITLPENTWDGGGQHGYPLTMHGAEVLLRDSHLGESLAWLQGRLHGRLVDVLHIDGDHSYEGARRDWEMYSPLVRPGGLVLIHDVLNVWDSRVHLARLWAELAAEHDNDVIRSKRSRPLGFGVITI